MRDLPGREHHKGQAGGRGERLCLGESSTQALRGRAAQRWPRPCRAGVVAAAGSGGAASPPPPAGHMRGAGGWAEAVVAAGAEAGLGGEGRGGGVQLLRAAAVVVVAAAAAEEEKEEKEKEEKKEEEKDPECPRGAERVGRAPGLPEPRPPRSALPAVPTWTKRVVEVAAVSAGLVRRERGPSAGAAGGRSP